MYSPAGRIDQWPAASSSSRPRIDGLSNRGNDSQSTEPSAVTRAAEWQSDSSACAAIAVVLMASIMPPRRADVAPGKPPGPPGRDGPGSGAYRRASYTMLNGVSPTRRKPLKPASVTIRRIGSSPAWAPSEKPPSWERAFGTQRNVENE